jgi:hypothetical protein
MTLEEMLKSAIRESEMRRRVYPAWVKTGRMTQAKADHEIACMDAIAEFLGDEHRWQKEGDAHDRA